MKENCIMQSTIFNFKIYMHVLFVRFSLNCLTCKLTYHSELKYRQIRSFFFILSMNGDAFNHSVLEKKFMLLVIARLIVSLWLFFCLFLLFYLLELAMVNDRWLHAGSSKILALCLKFINL